MKIGNIDTYTDLELALMVLLDYLGSGNERKKKLGPRYSKVQSLVNDILWTEVIPDGSGKSGYSKDDVKKALLKVEPSHEDYLDLIDDILTEL